jgi:fatty acid desaturase
MQNSGRQRPRIPRDFYRASLIGSAAFIGTAVALTVVLALLARLAFDLDLPLAARVALALPPIVLSGFGLHMLGLVGHEGTHLLLHPNKRVSMYLGLFFPSMIPTWAEMGFSISHWNHHRYTNQQGDPDCESFRRFPTVLRRMLFATTYVSGEYWRDTLRMAFGRPLSFSYRFAFREPEIKKFARWNLAFSFFWHAIYAGIAVWDPLAGLVSIAGPLTVVTFYSGVRPYIEHGGTEASPWGEARTRTHWLSTALHFANNYHLEHHLYPSVPCYRLPALHRLLSDQGALDRSPIARTLGAEIAAGALPYPTPVAAKAYDPLTADAD